MKNKILWCTSHYKTSFAKEKANELREKGYKVSYGNYLKEDGENYCKIYLDIDFNYYMIVILNDLNYYLSTCRMEVVEARNKKKNNIDELAKTHGVSIELLHNDSNNRFTAIINNGECEYTLK